MRSTDPWRESRFAIYSLRSISTSEYSRIVNCHPAKEEGIGLVEVLDRVTMQVFVGEYCTMIAAPVQCDVDGIPKGSHYASVSPMG